MSHKQNRFIDKYRLKLDKTKVPEQFHHLIPLAETWGINSLDHMYDTDVTRKIFEEASEAEMQAMVDKLTPHIVKGSQVDIYDWLARSEAQNLHNLSDEYIAFGKLVDAFYIASIRLGQRSETTGE